jgi:hypothetical protein
MNSITNTSQMSDTPSAFTNPSSKLGQKSAFTPMIQKPIPTKQYSPTMNLFEPSPIQKLLYMTAAAIVHQ